MKIIYSFPPNIDKIKKRFPNLPLGIVFTYGDAIYCPIKNAFIDSYLMTHEETHTKQQGDDIEGWWDKYLVDPKFRLDQELEAYRNQYRHFCRNKKDLGRQEQFLNRIASDLSGPAYGNIITLDEAKQFICQK